MRWPSWPGRRGRVLPGGDHATQDLREREALDSVARAPGQGWWDARGGQATPPNAARVADFLGGGTQHLQSDRVFADALEQRAPGVRGVQRATRTFLSRAVVYVMARGVRQFLVLGEGLVTGSDAHDVARMLDPTVRIAVVDSDPVTTAVNHSRLLLVPSAVSTRADLSRPNQVLGSDDVQAVLDLTAPVALLCGGALAGLTGLQDPAGVVAGYRAGLSGGSFLVAYHASGDHWPDAEEAASLWSEQVGPAPVWTREQMQDCLGGLDLVAPGVVDATAWRPRRSTLARGEHQGCMRRWHDCDQPRRPSASQVQLDGECRVVRARDQRYTDEYCSAPRGCPPDHPPRPHRHGAPGRPPPPRPAGPNRRPARPRTTTKHHLLGHGRRLPDAGEGHRRPPPTAPSRLLTTTDPSHQSRSPPESRQPTCRSRSWRC